VYSPFIFAPLWYDIEESFIRLLESRPMNIPFNATHSRSANSSTPPMLIKKAFSKSKAVYLYENGKKRLFGAFEVFIKHGYKVNDIVEISDVDFDDIPDGDVIID